jgi:hypothetical protein
MSGEPVRKTAAGWVHYLDGPDQPLTLSEFMALCLGHIRQNGLEARQAAEHTEGMLGAIDQFAADLAERSGLPYAASGEVRAALDARRDRQRAGALKEGQNDAV